MLSWEHIASTAGIIGGGSKDSSLDGRGGTRVPLPFGDHPDRPWDRPRPPLGHSAIIDGSGPAVVRGSPQTAAGPLGEGQRAWAQER